MKLNKQKRILAFIMLVVMLVMHTSVFATTDEVNVVEYTEEYKNWLNLTNEQKEGLIPPRMYEVPKETYSSKNPLKSARVLGSSLESKFSLEEYIPENTEIKNQMQTGECWAFATVAALETNLALKDYYSNKQARIYNFSERHMDYATSRQFLDGKVNEKGFNRTVGGTPIVVGQAYLTSGMGAVDESSLPFENNQDLIDISKIQGKKVTSQVFDTIDFPSYKSTDDKTQIKTQMKQHIKNNGGIIAAIHGAQLNSGYYNNSTGAIYCDNEAMCPVNHAVLIIGWDDNYNKNNFLEAHRPSSNGAWIIKNSWGTQQEYKLDEMLPQYKELIFTNFPDICRGQGWTQASQITDEYAKQVLQANGYVISGNKVTYKIGDDGIMYISYEDVNVYSQLVGIVNATNSTNYENIYQYDNYGLNYLIQMNSSKLYMANVFTKQTKGKEYVNQVLVYAPEIYTCKVYINPNGTGKSKSELQEVSLKAGSSETIGVGYHALEFSRPIEITSNNFVIVVEVQGTRQGKANIALEKNFPSTIYSYVSTQSQKCFIASEQALNSNTWIDTSTYGGDLMIKAYTVSENKSLSRITITSQPNKKNYVEGQDFDETGMVVKANYTDGASAEIKDYTIINGKNLRKGQTSITILYEGLSTSQPITVTENTIESIKVKNAPEKSTYYAGEDFDSKGMVIEATYKDGTKKDVTGYTIQNGKNLKSTQKTVTIAYEGKTVTQSITVQKNDVVSIEIQKEPNKKSYVSGQNFSTNGMTVVVEYENGMKKTVTDYVVKNGEHLKTNQTTVTVEYEGVSVTQAITVEEKVLSNIEIGKLPTKTTYTQNKDKIDLTGGTIKLIYNDGTSEELPMTDSLIQVSGFNNKTLGKNTVTLKYAEKTLTFDVTIIEEEIVKGPESSELKTAVGAVKAIKAYHYTDKTKQEYVTMNIEISNIQRDKENDSYEYYYYLSSSKDETNIKDWIKVTDSQTANDKLTFTINTKDIANYEEVSNSDTLYLYVKEEATKNGQKAVTVSNSMPIETEVQIEEFVDDKPTNLNNTGVDTTITNKAIPQTGSTLMFISLIIGVAILGIIVYIRYRNIDK